HQPLRYIATEENFESSRSSNAADRLNSLQKEYTKFMPYGIGISSAFLLHLVEPINLSSQQFLSCKRSKEEIVNDIIYSNDIMTRGGIEVDRELAHQMKEIHDLCLTFNLKFDKDF
uniref:Uncharacterized protein n=1 Tax=Glossina palpalis gambiensis TaxID=67801 RepID=A0A1B0C3L1_9MUSC